MHSTIIKGTSQMYIQPNVTPVECFKNNSHESLPSEMAKIKTLISKDDYITVYVNKWLQTDV